jgi:hypothetical protein
LTRYRATACCTCFGPPASKRFSKYLRAGRSNHNADAAKLGVRNVSHPDIFFATPIGAQLPEVLINYRRSSAIVHALAIVAREQCEVGMRIFLAGATGVRLLPLM